MEYKIFEERMVKLFDEMWYDFEKKLKIWSRTNVNGVVDIEAAEDDFILCKEVMHAYLLDLAWQYSPLRDLTRADKRRLDQIKSTIGCRYVKDPGMRIDGLNNVFEGTLIHATFRNYDLVTTFLEALKGTTHYDEFKKEIPLEAMEDDDHSYWKSDGCSFMLNEYMFITLYQYAPEGYYFGNTEGNSSDYGFWKFEEADDEE